MSRADNTTKQIAALKDYVARKSKEAGNQEAIQFLEGLVAVCEELHFRVTDCEKECNPPESFIHQDVPHRLR